MMTAFLAAVSVAAIPATGLPVKPGPQPVTYLLPAPETAIVFAPFLLAQKEGFYRARGLDVRFRIVSGGLHVGETLGRGEGDLGGAIGDTPIQLRARGIAVRGVALLGHHSFVTLMTRTDAPLVTSSSGIVGVPSLTDTTAYALDAWMRSVPIDPARVSVQAIATDALIDSVGRGRLAGMVGTVDWGVRTERLGVSMSYRPLDGVYPAMAQAIMASDATVRERPAMVRAFVRATLAGIDAIERDPAGSADVWRRLVPDSGYSRAEIVRIFTLLRDQVYGDAVGLGRFDRRTMMRAVAAAKAQGLIPASASGKDSFTNQFVGRSGNQNGK